MANQKQAATAAVSDLAADMLQLSYADSSTGIVFATDTAWQHEFEHSFPYHETTDQFSAIEEIKSDMESKKPMDRLLCGDVGYGKTEVAMRAAFKALKTVTRSRFWFRRRCWPTSISKRFGTDGRVSGGYRQVQPVLHSC